MTPTQRTLKYLKDEGWLPWVVERFVPSKPFPRRIDFLNCIDIIAIRKDQPPTGIQSCGQAFAEHDRKILAEPKAGLWLSVGCRLILVGWRKVKKKRGGKAMVWKPRIKEYTPSDFVDMDIKRGLS